MHQNLSNAALVVASLLVAPALAHASDLPDGVVARDTSAGLVLADVGGQPLYRLDLDRAAKRRRPPPGVAALCAAKCHQLWRPAPAPADFKPSGDWGVAEPSGVRQLTYKGDPLYSFTGASLAEAATLGVYPPYMSSYSAKPALMVDGVPVSGVYWHPAEYQPSPPKMTTPAGVSVKWVKSAYVFADPDGQALYTSDASSPCTGDCVGLEPLAAPLAAYPIGRWRIVETPDGRRGWSYRGRTVYRRTTEGAPKPDWIVLRAQ